MPYILLQRKVRIKKAGELRTFYPGDTIEIGKSKAIQWIMEGIAVDLFAQIDSVLYDSTNMGVIVLNGQKQILTDIVPLVFKPEWEGELPFKYNLLWSGTSLKNRHFLDYGWSMILSSWEMAVSLVNLRASLETYGTKKEKSETKKQLGDLRLPVYDANLIWLERTPDTIIFAKEYSQQLQNKVSLGHAFVRAWFIAKPLLFTMPIQELI